MDTLDNDYEVLYVDPPWRYKDGKDKTRKEFFQFASDNFPTMSKKELKKLEVPSICADNAIMFMWTTGPKLKEALLLLEAWGFTFKTTAFVWAKFTTHGKIATLPGRYTCGNAEFCLLATKGKCLLPAINNTRSLVTTHGPRKFSEKPDIVRENIEKMFPTHKRIELFSRHNLSNWHTWGNEVGKLGTIEREQPERYDEARTLKKIKIEEENSLQK